MTKQQMSTMVYITMVDLAHITNVHEAIVSALDEPHDSRWFKLATQYLKAMHADIGITETPDTKNIIYKVNKS